MCDITITNGGSIASSEIHDKKTKELQKLFHHLVEFINKNPADEDTIVFNGISSEDARRLLESIDASINKLERRRPRISYNSLECYFALTMPKDVHEVGSYWLTRSSLRWAATPQLLPPNFFDDIHITGSPRIDNFTGQGYLNTTKEPDACLRNNNSNMPKLAIEAGWTETKKKLKEDALIWSDGGNVPVVITIKFSKIKGTNQVRGWLEWRSNQPLQNCQIFPIPNPPDPDPYLTLGDIFGLNHPTAANQLPLLLQDLRSHATTMLGFMNLVPAP